MGGYRCVWYVWGCQGVSGWVCGVLVWVGGCGYMCLGTWDMDVLGGILISSEICILQ